MIDFGSGWGRITRTLLRDFRPEHVVGVDPLESMVEACRDWFASSAVSFETVDNWPPLSQANESVDLIVAYSVFSHLPERLATAWIAEFARVLKPGGIVVATTQSRSFIDLCEQMRTDPSVSTPGLPLASAPRQLVHRHGRGLSGLRRRPVPARCQRRW